MIDNKMRNLIQKYKSTDIRLKLRYLKKKTNINFYPNFFTKTGLSSFYTRIIFFLIVFERFIKDTKIKYNRLFNTNYRHNKIKFINTFPRSGTTYLRNVLCSYYELIHNDGDGIPKYDKSKDRFFYNVFHQKNLVPMNLFKLAHQDLDLNDYRNYWIRKRKFDYNNFYISHFPISKDDLIPSRKLKKQAFLIRDPINSCISYIKHSLNFQTFIFNKKKRYNRKILKKHLNNAINEYKLFFEYLILNKKKSHIIIYDNLTKNPLKSFGELFSFFNLDINKLILKKAIKINSKKNIIKLIYSGRNITNRISNFYINKKDLILLKKKIKEKLNKEINEFNNL